MVLIETHKWLKPCLVYRANSAKYSTPGYNQMKKTTYSTDIYAQTTQ